MIKTKNIFIVILLMFSTNIYSQCKNFVSNFGREKRWSNDSILTLRDFKRKEQAQTINERLGITVGFSTGYSSFRHGKKSLNIDICIEAIYSFSDKLYYLEGKKNNALLHEQGIYDISEIFARKFRAEVQKDEYLLKKVFSEKFDDLYKTFFIELRKYSKQYNEETENGTNEIKQNEWNIKIAKELANLEQYSNPLVKVTLRKK